MIDTCTHRITLLLKGTFFKNKNSKYNVQFCFMCYFMNTSIHVYSIPVFSYLF